ncbi:protein kinase domain-containing protein [Curtobacterium sp. BRD11]|uniref:protein kinase domain-containing protein n=1 Tax=Curtobacterium sp. BRD11 TaxID=2962581 RepID=UPI00288293E1|nr:NERD domain-containing protein [Curtobacterium sp. BRD11]MDT0208995.1 NERD domain-containing protein [Curtobacterium sp. BRD11]
MREDSRLWRVMGDPAHAQEAAALARVRALLPDDGIARAWVNVTFTDADGRLNEVDALVVTRSGLLLVELKGWHGQIVGDQSTWHHNGRAVDNPRKLANSKAKRLASVLKDVAHAARLPSGAVPYVAEAVVLHEDPQVRLDQYGVESVWALDGYNVRGLGQGKKFSDLLTRAPRRAPIDRAQANNVDRLMEAAGLMPRARQRMIGDYALDSGEPLGEGPGWQDFLVTHPRTKLQRRIRLFPYPKGASREVRAAVDLRAAREMRLTDGIRHDGIVGPAETFFPDEGAALVFPYDADELSLAAYMAQHEDLNFEARDRLVQDLAELVRFAHGQRLTHRALSPLSVRVRVTGETTTLRIRDWDLARRPVPGTSTSTEVGRGLTDVAAAVDGEASLYLAPETQRGQTPASPQTLDVYGVGAVAYLIFTGKPPAVNVAALQGLVASQATGLDPRAVMPEIPDMHAQLVRDAAAFRELDRTLDIGDFLVQLAAARVYERGDAEPVPALTDPLDAAEGEIVGDRFEIVRRRGSGSTGVALEVADYDSGREGVILKLAKDDSAAARLAVEADVLQRLDSPRIVRHLDGPLAVGTRQGLLMTDAGEETLADRIRIEGKATIEQLERYGADLFEAVAHLDSRGVFHRDIKPSNLAIKPDPGNRKPRLTLFDFSLADEPLTNIRSGSSAYLDPYLGHGGRAQYDSAAERFSVATTLFELATGDPIWWSDGDAPSSATDAPVLQATMFDPAVAEGLGRFFTAALAPAVADRHPSLHAMQQAWTFALAGATVGVDDAAANESRASAATLDTSLRESGLSARALSALARVPATTVGELLGVPPMTINQLRGLGEQIRREIQGRIRQWRQRLAKSDTQTDVPVQVGRRSVEDFLGAIKVKSEESSEDRYKRLKKNGTLRAATEDAARWVRDLGGVATLDELAMKLLREYGSTLTDDIRQKAAAEVLRAVLEVDIRSGAPKFVYEQFRDRPRTVIAYAPDDGAGLTFDEAELHLEALHSASDLVDQLLAESDVVPGPQLRESLLGSGMPALRLPDTRTAQLAIGLSKEGRISSLGEAYRADLPSTRAVVLALRGAATRELAIVTIEHRVRARFPEISTVPLRPDLDQPVRLAMPYLEWRADLGKYVIRANDAASLTVTGSSTTWGRTEADPAMAARLRQSIENRGALTVVVSRRHGLLASAQRLGREHGLHVVDLADLALDALRTTATAKNIQWPTVLRADGQAEGSQDRRNLLQLARLAIEPAWTELLATTEPLLLVNAAVVARFGLVDLVAAVTDLATPRAAARWFLLPRPAGVGTPDLDGVPFPFGPDGYLELSLDHLPATASEGVRGIDPLAAAVASTRKASAS